MGITITLTVWGSQLPSQYGDHNYPHSIGVTITLTVWGSQLPSQYRGHNYPHTIGITITLTVWGSQLPSQYRGHNYPHSIGVTITLTVWGSQLSITTSHQSPVSHHPPVHNDVPRIPVCAFDHTVVCVLAANRFFSHPSMLLKLTR